jgi:hypothetical protein
MKLLAMRTPIHRTLAAVLVTILVAGPPLQAFAQDVSGPQSLRERFDLAMGHITSGQYAQSESILREIIRDYQGSDLRKAWDLLTWTVAQDRGRDEARTVAREALEIYPDLTNDRINVPQDIGAIYDELRAEMFGALQIEALDENLQECPVWLNGELRGTLPLYLDLVRSGDYELKVGCEGYKEYVSTIKITPDRDTIVTITLEKKSNKTWLIGAGAVVAAVVVVALSGGDSATESGPTPLPGPPDPPAK